MYYAYLQDSYVLWFHMKSWVDPTHNNQNHKGNIMYLWKQDNKALETLHWGIFLQELAERCPKEENPTPLAGWHDADEDQVQELDFS